MKTFEFHNPVVVWDRYRVRAETAEEARELLLGDPDRYEAGRLDYASDLEDYAEEIANAQQAGTYDLANYAAYQLQEN